MLQYKYYSICCATEIGAMTTAYWWETMESLTDNDFVIGIRISSSIVVTAPFLHASFTFTPQPTVNTQHACRRTRN